MLKKFNLYLEMVQKNRIIDKINEIIDFKRNIRGEDINKETFTFLHFREGQDFNPVIYTNEEGTTNFYVPTIQELLVKINEENLLSTNNTLTYNIEYMEDGAIVNKSFGSQVEEIKMDNETSSSYSEKESYSYKK